VVRDRRMMNHLVGSQDQLITSSFLRSLLLRSHALRTNVHVDTWVKRDERLIGLLSPLPDDSDPIYIQLLFPPRKHATSMRDIFHIHRHFFSKSRCKFKLEDAQIRFQDSLQAYKDDRLIVQLSRMKKESLPQISSHPTRYRLVLFGNADAWAYGFLLSSSTTHSARSASPISEGV
jgi:hypothetical protein